MNFHLKALLEQIETSIADSLDHLENVDAEDFDETLEDLSTALVHGAMQLHSCRQSQEDAVDGLLTCVFDEVFRSMPADDREGFQGQVLLQTHATMSMDGVVPCQDWTVSYTAAPGWKRVSNRAR